jgi:hypothetical protein
VLDIVPSAIDIFGPVSAGGAGSLLRDVVPHAEVRAAIFFTLLAALDPNARKSPRGTGAGAVMGSGGGMCAASTTGCSSAVHFASDGMLVVAMHQLGIVFGSTIARRTAASTSSTSTSTATSTATTPHTAHATFTAETMAPHGARLPNITSRSGFHQALCLA